MDKIGHLKKLKASVIAFLTAGAMLASSQSVNAEGDNVKKLVDAMTTGDRISLDLTKEEFKQLVIEAENAVKNDGVNLLPFEIQTIYNSLPSLTGKEKEKQTVILIGLCDYILKTGEANMMSYPQAIQFETVCEALKDIDTTLNETESSYDSEYLNAKDIYNQAKTNKEIIKSRCIIALETDLGFYDYCFLGEQDQNIPTVEQDQNMPTGEKENGIGTISGILGGTSLIALSPIVYLITENINKKDDKKEEKGKSKQKRR